jgi:PAS domain S-box-containing protein
MSPDDIGDEFVDDAARLAAIVRSSDDAIYSKDRRARVRSWNPAAERLYGWREQEALGRPVSFVIPPDRAGEELTILNEILEGNRIEDYETKRLCKNGDVIDVVISVSPLMDTTGTIVGASVIARDIGERNRARALEEKLKRLEFVNFVAHELRTPLTAIGAGAKFLEDATDVDPDTKKVIDIIIRQAKTSEHLVRDLLDLSRMNSGRFEVDLQEVRLASVIPSVVESNPAPEGKVFAIEVPNDMTVIGDPDRLHQVLTNLLTNAFKYGGDNVRLGAVSENHYVRVVVEDDGSGLPVGRETDAFDAFVRMPGSRGPGSGLGLAIAQGLVEAQQGTIRYETRQPHGSRFVVELKAPRTDN